VITTNLALPAVWWYGAIPISDDAGAGRGLRDGSPIYEADLTHDCPSRQLEDALKNHSRVLLYLGFGVIPGFDAALLRDLAQLGGLSAHRQFGKLGRAAVIDLRMPASDAVVALDRTRALDEVQSGGCVSVRRAKRW
jgi:hypothetical protein